MMRSWKDLKFHLNDGHSHPVVGFGTYKIGYIPPSASGQNGEAGFPDHDVDAIIKAVLETGTRCFDCAEYYGNEDRLGAALAKSGVNRRDLFLVCKVWTTNIYAGHDAVRASVEQSLRNFQTDYIDLVLIHWPVPGKHVDAYRALESLQKEGKVRSIGVSNYTIEDVEELLASGCSVPAVNQLEINPFLYRAKTIHFMKSKGIVLQAYRGLHNGKSLEHPLVVQLAAKYGCTPAQLMGKFLLQNGIVFFSKSVHPERIEANTHLDHFIISLDDLQLLQTLTTRENLEACAKSYRIGVVRDTPLQESTVPFTLD